MAELLREPVPNEAAAVFIAGKPVVRREVFARLLPELKARAFMIGGIEGADVLQRCRDAIAELPRGANWDDVKADLVEELNPYFVDPDAEPDVQAKQRIAADRRAELLVRIHGFQAYAAGKHEAMTAEADVMPYWQYISMEDSRVRPTHAALNGIVMPADSPFWADHYPPWDWGCRCEVVPLDESDIAELQEADKALPPEQQRILSERAQQRLIEEGRLARGPSSDVDVRSPRNKGKEGAWTWHPGDLRLSPEDLRQSYDDETWAAFERWAGDTEVDKGVSVLAWMSGATLADAAAATATTAGGLAKGVALSKAVSVALQNRVQADGAKRALAAIDSVHGDGDLDPIRFLAERSRNTYGSYAYTNSGKAARLALRTNGPTPALTAAHEIGHLLDHQTLGRRGRFASESDPIFADWLEKVKATEEYGKIDIKPVYYKDPKEMWARSYAQWIAVRSGDRTMLDELNLKRGGRTPWVQWSDESFGPVAAAIDTIMKQKEWMK